jgi:hypothetical protein
MLGDGELAGSGGAQDVTMPGRHRKPTLRIQTERRSPLKHCTNPLLLIESIAGLPQTGNGTFHH